MRKILSAKDQVEMLAPWRLAAGPKKLYRGLQFNLNDPDHKELRDIMFPDLGEYDEDQPNSRHPMRDDPGLGELVLNHLSRGGEWAGSGGTSLGRHWSTVHPDSEEAQGYDYEDIPGFSDISYLTAPHSSIGVRLEGDWDGSGQDHDGAGTSGDYPGEHEVTLHPGTPINVTGLHIQHPDNPDVWESVLPHPSPRTASIWRYLI